MLQYIMNTFNNTKGDEVMARGKVSNFQRRQRLEIFFCKRSRCFLETIKKHFDLKSLSSQWLVN